MQLQLMIGVPVSVLGPLAPAPGVFETLSEYRRRPDKTALETANGGGQSAHAVGREKGAQLKSNWKITQKVLLADIESPHFHTVDNALKAFIGFGKADIIPVLLEVLEARGNKTMAEAYLNCRHRDLENAAGFAEIL